MSWTEQTHDTRKSLNVDAERMAVLNALKQEKHPVIAKEAAAGDKTFKVVQFQPVKSPGRLT